MGAWHDKRRRGTRLAGGLALAALLALPASAGADDWYKLDLHHHTTLSSDAVDDMGIVAAEARAQNYDAIFLTDHNLGSSFPISGVQADDVPLDDSLARWTRSTFGSLTTSATELVSDPV